MDIKPKVSVIVPIYNVEKYLSKCLDSIIDQTFEEYEIICINDCTPDDSQRILDEYCSRYPEKIKCLINDKNMGLGLTRNRGVEQSQGDYIMFIDSDDYIKNDYIQRYYEGTDRGKKDVVIGGFIRVRENRNEIHHIEDNLWATLTYAITCAKMYKKEFILKNDLFFKNYKPGEDIHFNCCAYCCKMDYQVIDYEGYYYLDNSNSITNSLTYKKKPEETMLHIFEDVLKRYRNVITESQTEVLAYVCFVNLMNVLIQYNRKCGIALMKQKYDLCFEFLKREFPEYKKNRYLRIGQPKGQTRKIMIATSVVMLLHRMKLDKALFYFLAVC